MRRAMVVTVSNRAAQGVYADTTGPIIVERLAELGFAAAGPEVVPDGAPVEAALRRMLSLGYDVIITTGGSRASPQGHTPALHAGGAGLQGARAISSVPGTRAATM